MKLLFVHETKIKQDTYGNYYTTGSYNKHVWERYLSLANDLTLISRKESKTYDAEFAKSNFNELDKERIKFVSIPNTNESVKSYFSIKLRNEKNEIIDQSVKESDFLIVRLPSDAGYVSIKAAEKYSKPYLVEVVGCPWDSMWNYNLKGKILAPYSYYKLRSYVKKASYVIYVTNKFLQNRYPNNHFNIGCSDVRLLEFKPKILQKRLAKINNLRKEDAVVLGTTAAVDVKYKGQEYIIQAIGKLKKDGYRFKYLLAGGGDQSYLKKIAKEYDVVSEVVFLGSLPHEEVFTYLDNIDVYVQPSKQEGLPRALVEAMSRGCPSIGSSTGGIPELLNEHMVFAKGNVRDIINILKAITKEVLIEEAERSFNKSQEFAATILDSKRMNFYKRFIEDNCLNNIADGKTDEKNNNI